MSLKESLHKEKRYVPGDDTYANAGQKAQEQIASICNTNTADLLAEHESTHGDFEENAICCEKMYRAWAARWLHAHGSEVPFPMAHAMYHKFSKLSHLAANEHCQDHYDDDIGYTELARRFS